MKKALFMTVAALALMTNAALATSVVTETRVEHRPYSDADVVDFTVFDINNDHTLTMQEIGEKLFYTFDKDGNQLIDNIEFDKPMVMTFAPMERQTFQFIDYNNDGVTDVTQATSERFLQQTGLSRFSGAGDGGLSAADFIDKPMKRVDRDLSGQIDIREWKEAYFASLRPLPQNDTFRYNE